MGSPTEEDLLNWAHHSSPTSVPDVLFQAAAGDEVSDREFFLVAY